MLTIEDIKKILPHREPFLMIDRVTDYVAGKSASSIKAVSGNEWFFMGHFEKTKLMPGVLILEAMAQTGGIALMTKEEMKGKLAFLARINKAKFRKKVIPGDTLVIDTIIDRIKLNVGMGSSVAKVNGEVVATCELVFAIGDEEN